MTKKRRWSVTFGSVAVWIKVRHPTEDNPGYGCCTPNYTQDDRRQRPACSTSKKVKSLAQRLATGDSRHVVLTANACLGYSRALQDLSPLQVSFDVAATEFARAIQLLAAARYYTATHGVNMCSLASWELVDGLLQTSDKRSLVGANKTRGGLPTMGPLGRQNRCRLCSDSTGSRFLRPSGHVHATTIASQGILGRAWIPRFEEIRGRKGHHHLCKGD